MKIGIIGDAHFRDNLGYSDFVADGRRAEKKEILDFVVESFKDCDHVVLLGDNFNSRNNSSETNREFVEFIERFKNKDVYIISGNHEKKGNGKTAIDFLGEVKKKNWHIFTRPGSMQIEKLKVDFLPYMLNPELEVENHEEAVKEIMKHLDGGDILFAHHAISGTSFNGIKTDLLKEVVLPKAKLEKKYKWVIAGHIHEPQQVDKTVIAGSLFTYEVGEVERFIYKINGDLDIEKIKVPGRGIYKFENPRIDTLLHTPPDSIVKVILTDKSISVEEVKANLDRFAAHLLIEDYPDERKKIHIKEGAMDFSIEALLKLYAEEKSIDYQKLLKGLNLINV